MKKLYEQSPEMQLSGKCQLRHVKCTHHKGYLMEDLSMIKSGFYEISFCKSGDFLFRIGQKRHFITNGDILVIYACGASTCLLVKIINYALKYSNEFIEIESDQTNQIVRYLDQHFLKEIGVEDLARTFHMSKSSLNKFFQKQLNTTCHQYILKKRLALAVSLIRQDVPLKTVAVQSGFGDYSSFFRAFKKMYHISPTECQADNEKLKKIKH